VYILHVKEGERDEECDRGGESAVPVVAQDLVTVLTGEQTGRKGEVVLNTTSLGGEEKKTRKEAIRQIHTQLKIQRSSCC
jgi:hypothetical protein